MNIGKVCPLPLCILLRDFRMYLYIVSLVAMLRNWIVVQTLVALNRRFWIENWAIQTRACDSRVVAK